MRMRIMVGGGMSGAVKGEGHECPGGWLRGTR